MSPASPRRWTRGASRRDSGAPAPASGATCAPPSRRSCWTRKRGRRRGSPTRPSARCASPFSAWRTGCGLSTRAPLRAISCSASPTMFNFYRPGYVPPNTSIATAGLVAPELQIVNEVSVVGYSNFMRSAVQNGLGSGSPRDIQPDYTAELALADNADLLIDRVSLLLTAGSMSAATRTIVRDAVNSITMPTTNQATARQNRVRLAVFFTLSSPDYLVQK